MCSHIIGSGGGAARALLAATGARVAVSTDKRSVYLFGPPPALNAARRALDTLLLPAASLSIAELRARGGVFETDDDCVAFLVAGEARLLRGIAARSGARVIIPDAGSVGHVRGGGGRGGRRLLHVFGPPDAAARANALIAGALMPTLAFAVADRWGHLLRDGTYRTPSALRGTLVGPRGRALFGGGGGGLGVHVSRDGSTVGIFGGAPADAAALAAALDAHVTPTAVVSLGAELGHLVASGAVSSLDTLAKVVVGRRAERLTAFAGRHAGVEMWAAASSSSIMCSGPPAGVAGAVAELLAFFRDPLVVRMSVRWASHIAAGAYTCPRALRGAILDDAGRRISAAEAELGVVATFGDDALAVFGPPEAARSLLARLDAYVAPAYVIDIAATWGHLIGAGVYGTLSGLVSNLIGPHGQNMQALNARGGGLRVALDASCRRVLIWGPPDAAAGAREALDAVLVPVGSIPAAHLRELADAADMGSVPSVCQAALGMRRLVRPAAGVPPVHFCLSPDEARVFILGPRAAVEDAVAVLATTALSVVVLWTESKLGHLIEMGAYRSVEELGSALRRAAHKVEADAGVRVWVASDGSRAAVFGEGGALPGAEEALLSRVAPARVIPVADAWGHLLGRPGTESPSAVVDAVLGRRRERAVAIGRASGVQVTVSAGYRLILLWGPVPAAVDVALQLVQTPLATTRATGAGAGGSE